ncbi:MAG: right-handed parallel beta-helix repeat-containing protein [Chitinophagaceae bacterium]|nr:right-handed parallel beta-helix repeat-containing protein [Chitinophagaceae bacterium]
MNTLIWSLLIAVSTVSARTPHNWYFDPSGDDAGGGDKTHPFRSIQRLNSLTLGAGDTLFFRSGQVFRGELRLQDGAMGVPGHPIVITSYGQGKAVIDGGNGAAIALYKAAHIVLSNLELRGAGRKEGSTESGLVINTCRDITADSLIVSGFQKSGAYVYQSVQIRLTRILARDNGFAGISADGPYGKRDCHHILIRDCRAENNPGDPTNLSNHSGNGIVVGYCRNVLIEGCIATENGWDMPRVGNGPVGIWAFEADSVIIRHCISFRNKTAKGADDGGGFDLDGGVAHSVIEHCVSYENEGSGFGLFQYAGASPWHDNSIHDCSSTNDGLVSAARAGVFIWNSSRDPRQLRNGSFYNNVVYNTNGAVIHYASESEHRGFQFHHNVFIASDSLITGMTGADDVFGQNHWTGVLPDSSFH